MHSTEFGELASVLYCRVPGDLYVEFRAVPESRGRTWQKFIPVKRVFNLTVSQHRDEHSFFGVLPRLAKGSGKAANVAMGSAVWVDLDGDGGQLDLRGLPWPSALVCTSPGKFQCYWAMDDPILLYLVEDINQRLV